MFEKGVPPLSHRDQLAGRILLVILSNAAHDSTKSMLASSYDMQKSLTKRCLEMADAMIACQKAD